MNRIGNGCKLLDTVLVWTTVLAFTLRISVSPAARAKEVDGLFALGATHCDGITCDAYVGGIIPRFAYVDD